MRDDELSRVPKSIEPWRVMEFLRDLGITPEDVYETTIGIRQVVVRMWATDEKGSRYFAEDGNRPAEHAVSIALVGSWKKPEPQVQPKYEQNSEACPEPGCTLEFGHDHDHQLREHGF